MESKDLKSFGLLMLALFVIAIITALTYIGMDYLKETACEQNQDAAHVWQDGVCQESATNTTAVTLTSVTKIGVVEAVIDIALGLLALVVVVAIFKVVVKTAKGFN
jgi:hypothetical protein